MEEERSTASVRKGRGRGHSEMSLWAVDGVASLAGPVCLRSCGAGTLLCHCPRVKGQLSSRHARFQDRILRSVSLVKASSRFL